MRNDLLVNALCMDGVNRPLPGDGRGSTMIKVIVPPVEVVEAYNRFDTSMTEPCPACGEEWKWVYAADWWGSMPGHGWELNHLPGCDYITWLEQDCPCPDGIIPA